MKKDINILYRSDGKAVSIEYYNYGNAFNIKCFDIAKLNFNNIDNIKMITKEIIINHIYKENSELVLSNKYLDISATLSKSSVRKMISTIFDSTEGDKSSYRIKKELISNIVSIFYNAIPICKHPELKYAYFFDKQLIYRFGLPVSINGTDYLVMLTLKELMINNQLNLTKISIYDFRSKKALDRIPYTSNRCTHSQEHTYSITDLREFVNSLLIKYSNIKDLRF